MLLLHVSDFHFGPKSRFAELAPAEFAKRFAADLKHQLGELKLAGGIDVVVATGDFAESGTKKEFAQAADFLRTLAQELDLPPVRFVLLPGNHDISWAACQIVELEQKQEGFDDDERDRRIHKKKLDQYERMVADFYSPSALADLARPLAGGGWLYGFADLGLSVAALNSCEKETHRPGERYGFLSTAQSQSVLDVWKTSVEAFRVLALHHPPVSVTPKNVDAWRAKVAGKDIGADQVERFIADLNGIEGSRELRNLAEQADAQLVLHGHQHAGDTNHWADGLCHVISAGSLCLVSGELPADEPLGYKLVALARGRRNARVWSFVFDPRDISPDRVVRGAFGLDPSEKKQPRELQIKVPKATKAARAKSTLGTAQMHFLQVYRQAFEADFDRWDLSTSGVTTAGRFREAPAALDRMYLPLRLVAGWNPQQLDRGEVLEPAALLQREGSLLIRGPAGAGKTTWVRHTFRRLIRDQSAFPLLLVLRDLALGWRPEVQGKRRSLVAYLEDKIAERLGGLLPAGRLQIQPLLAAETGPRPVLLVDGWDEIGPLGEDIRKKLRALMRLHPRLLVVVTSRPYNAGGRPSSSDGFVELDVQPLNDDEMSSLAGKFFRHLFGADEARAAVELSLFSRALERSVEARELGRIPLLLTMMLGIHSVEPLPDKRHRLYEACIRNLMANLPERKAEEGARVGLDQWCPDSDERLRVVARLAFELQESGYGESFRTTIVASRKELLKFLPAKGEWRGRQELFLNWLVGTAGLLTDRADGTLAFSHLSFQEYLAAYHLKATLAGEDRLCSLASDGVWWETLLLWAALVGSEDADRAQNMIKALLRAKEERPTFLTGMMLADGLGSQEQLAEWACSLPRHLARDGRGDGVRVARAFAASRQESRQVKLLELLDKVAAEANWFDWERLVNFVEVFKPGRTLPQPRGLLTRSILCQLEGREQEAPLGAATARCLAGAHPLWPFSPTEWALLQAWPARRRLIGARIELGVVTELTGLAERLASVLARESDESDTLRDLARKRARYWADDLVRSLVSHASRDFARNWVRDWVGSWARDWPRDLARGGMRYRRIENFQRYWDCAGAKDLVRGLVRHLPQDSSSHWALDWARDLGLSASPELLDVLGFELAAFGRPGARAWLSFWKDLPDDPRWRLLQQACRFSFNPSSSPARFEKVLANEGPLCGDDLWPALARHLARRALSGDRELLEEAVRNPESRPEPLRSGLQFIARGDVMFNDGSVKTLEEICEDHGIEVDLPLLEDMPDEIDLGPDWDKEPEDMVHLRPKHFAT